MCEKEKAVDFHGSHYVVWCVLRGSEPVRESPRMPNPVIVDFAQTDPDVSTFDAIDFGRNLIVHQDHFCMIARG